MNKLALSLALALTVPSTALIGCAPIDADVDTSPGTAATLHGVHAGRLVGMITSR